MNLLEFYILRRVCRNLFSSFLLILAIIWIKQILQRINIVTDSGQSIITFMRLAIMIFPTIIPVIMPFTLVIAITQTLDTFNKNSELTIIDSTGAPRTVLIRPILSLAIVLSVFSFIIKNTIEPKFRVAARQIIATTYADLLSSILEEKTFHRISDCLYIEISKRYASRVFKGLFVVDSRDPAVDLIYYAREGIINANVTSLIMKDGEVHRKPAKNNDVSIVKFYSYSFDLSSLIKSRKQITLRAGDRDLGFLLNPNPDDPQYKAKVGEYRAEMHKRLMEWLLPIVFSLVSLAVSGNVHLHRTARIHPTITAIAISFGLNWIFSYVVQSIEKNSFLTPLLYLLLPCFSGIIIFFITRQQRKLLTK